MPQPEHFDALVLGSGQGGQLIAWHLAQSGPAHGPTGNWFLVMTG